MGDFQRIAAFLGAVRRRLWWVHVGAGTAAALGAAAAMGLLCALGAAATGPRALWPPPGV